MVALALIFSIQQCDPAPFYLFDEIDQVTLGIQQLVVAVNMLSVVASSFFLLKQSPLSLSLNDMYGILLRRLTLYTGLLLLR